MKSVAIDCAAEPRGRSGGQSRAGGDGGGMGSTCRLSSVICLCVASLIVLVGSTNVAAAQETVEHDRAALVALYRATEGENWEESDNWLSNEPINSWWGVEAVGGRVIRLYLHFNRLTGPIPPELGDLRSLVVLSLSENSLTGPIPRELANLHSLNALHLDGNQLTGPIPPELGNLRNLSSLVLENNGLTGTIPPELGNLRNLGVLDLGGTQLAGPLPVEMGSLDLTIFRLFGGTRLCLPSTLADWHASIRAAWPIPACENARGVSLSLTALRIDEGGSGTYSVRLATAPAGDVTVTPRSDGAGLTISPATLTFTPSNWSTPQTVTVEAAEDDDDADDASLSIAHVVAGYGEVTDGGTIDVAISDNDDPVMPTIGIGPASTPIDEGSTATFTLTATPPPAAPLRVSVTVGQTGDFLADGQTGTLTVTIGTAGTGTLTVATDDDDVDEADGAVTAILAGGEGYEVSAFVGSASVAVNDNDTPPTADAPEAEAVEETVRAVAAGSLANVTSNIGARFSSVDSGVTLTLAGQRLFLDEAAATLASFDDGLRAWSDTAPGGEDATRGRGLGFDELLQTSAFEIALGAAEGEGFLAGRWTVWGRGDVLFFDDDSDSGGRYDGDLKAGYLGVDAWIDDRWLAGVAASRIVVDSDYFPEGAGDRGRLEVTLTGLHPYLRYAPEAGPELWAILGAGTGEIGDTRQGAGRETNDLRMLMAAAGVRQSLAPVLDGIDLAVLGDAGFGRIDTDSSPGLETIGNLSVDTWRARAGIEASHTSALESGATVTPSVEVAARLDGGGGNEAGVEVSAAVLFADPVTGVGVEARGRMLALYSDSAYSEYGASVTASVSPGPGGEGLSLSVSPRFGAPTGGGTAMLWSENRFGLADEAVRREAEMSLDAEAGYGFAVGAARRGVLAPFAALRLAAGGESVRTGVRFGTTRPAVGGLTFELAGERRAYDTGETDRRIDLIGRVGF